MPNTWADLASDAAARGNVADEPALRAELDGIARLAARLLQAPIALVSLKTESAMLFLGRAGWAAEHSPPGGTLCAEALSEAPRRTVCNVLEEPRLAAHPLVAGAPHVRFYAGWALINSSGTRVGSLCVMDTAPRGPLAAEDLDGLETLAKAAMACLERWRAALHESQRQAAASRVIDGMERRFETLAEDLPQLVWSSSPDGLSDYFSPQWCRFTGAPAADSYGTGWQDFLHPEDLPATREAWRHAVATASPYAVEYRLRGADGTYRWMLARGLPVKDDNGHVTRWVGTCTDIDDRVRSGEILELMSRELTHRIKNLFAVVQGLVSMTLRKHEGMAPVSKALQSRLVALGRAHDLTRPRVSGGTLWNSDTTLKQLIHLLIAPYLHEDPDRLEMLGDDVRVDEQSATPLALFFHEMATNSARYGALGSAGGKLRVVVAVDGEVRIDWKESGGPIILQPPRPGFGLDLAKMSVERQLKGALKMDWSPAGLHAEARFPASQLCAAQAPPG